MNTTIDQQTTIDEALVPHAQRLRIGRSNFRLLSDINSKESTLQVVYNVLRICLFFKAFLVTTDVPEIYMQEFWATATVHHYAIRFKMDNKKHIVNLKSFRDMLHICPRVDGQTFAEPPFEEQILAFIRFLGHSAAIMTLTDVNINKLYQPWRSFAAIINKCLSGKSSGYDSLRLSQAYILRTRSSSDTSITPPTGAVNEGIGSIPGVLDAPTDEYEEELSWNSTNDEGAHNEGKDGDDDEEDEDDDGEEGDGNDDDEDDNGKEGNEDDDQEVERDEDKDDEEESGDDEQEYAEEEYDEETTDEESFDHIPKTLKNSDDEGNGDEDLGLNVGGEEGHIKEEKEDELYRDITINQGRGIQAILEVEDSHVVNPDGMASIFETTSQMDTQTPTSRMNEAVKVAIQIQSDHLCDEAQRENDEFLKTVDENMQKIIKEQLSHSSRTSYAVATDLSEMELKKILIEKMEGNKSIQRSDEQRNLYKALVEAYKSNKIILDTYRETVTLMRRRNDDADKDEEPFVGPDRRSKRRRERKEPESASAPIETATRSAGRSTQGFQSRQASKSEFAFVEEPVQTTCQMEDPSHLEFDTGGYVDPRTSSWPNYELMKGSCKSLVELEYHLEEVFKATTDQLDWVNPEGQQCLKYTTSITKMKAANYGHIKWIEDFVPRTMWIEEPIGYDKHAFWESPIWGVNRRMEDLQLGVESNQKKLNLTKSDSYRSDLNDGTLIDVRTALDDRLNGIRMLYLPQSIWRKSDKDRAAAMIQAINKRLKTRRIMRSLERFVGGRLYEGDFRMLQRTI
nr:hypothetical protein [Tanacetum cinerariifolium]